MNPNQNNLPFNNNNINNINNQLYPFSYQPNFNNNIPPNFGINQIPNMNNPYPNQNLFANNNIYNMNPNNFYNNFNNQNSFNDVYINNGDINNQQKNKAANPNQNKSYQNNNSTMDDKKELEYYFKELKEEEKKDKLITEINRKNTYVFMTKDNSFSYGYFTKAPTTYLENLNLNFTYMTCVIQCLANIAPIAKFYLKEKKNFAKNMNKFALNYAFSRAISNIYSFPEEQEKQFYSCYKIDEFRQIVIEINGFFRGTSTKDANKFIIFLLDKLQDEQQGTLNSKINNGIHFNDFKDFNIYYKELLNQNNSLFFNCFNWIRKKERSCPYEHKTIEINNFLTQELDIENCINQILIKNVENENPKYEIRILDCIKNEFENKKFYNLNCFKCKQKTNLEQNGSILISPNYFIFLTGLREKLTNIYEKFKKSNDSNEKFIFKIEEEIDLSEVISCKDSYTKYQLDGLISYNFDENNKSRIYYVAYYRSPIDKCWYKYTTDNFGKIDVKIVLKSFEDYYLFPSIFIYRHK